MLCGFGKLLQNPEKEQLFQDEQDSIVQAPQREIPAGTVPEAGQEPDDEQIQQLTAFTPPVSAQGNIDIFPKPGGQRRQNSVTLTDI